MEESETMGDAAATGEGETRRGLDVERSRHPRGSLTRDGGPTCAPRAGGVAASARAAHALWFREVLDTLDLLEFYPRTALRLIYLGGLTQAQAARQSGSPRLSWPTTSRTACTAWPHS